MQTSNFYLMTCYFACCNIDWHHPEKLS